MSPALTPNSFVVPPMYSMWPVIWKLCSPAERAAPDRLPGQLAETHGRIPLGVEVPLVEAVAALVVEVVDDEQASPESVATAADQVHATSNSPAAPMPPPMHIVTTTFLAPRRLPSIRA